MREPAQQARLTRQRRRVLARRRRRCSRSAAPTRRRHGASSQTSLIPQQRAIDGLVAQFLIANNQVQEEAARANRDVYDRVGREILLLVGGLLVVTAGVGAWIVVSNRRAFQEVADVSAQLRTLSWRMLRVQEDVQRSIARELHDDFGQILTAIGTLLGRARRQMPADTRARRGARAGARRSPSRRSIAFAIDRSGCIPGVLDDFGLERALENCVEQFQQQTGIRTHLRRPGPVDAVREDCAIHVYRIAQEALSNAARHSGSAGGVGAHDLRRRRPRARGRGSRQGDAGQAQRGEKRIAGWGSSACASAPS